MFCSHEKSQETFDKARNRDIDWNVYNYACFNCKYTFLMKEDMVSHFQSLHPTEANHCSQCNEIICGSPKQFEQHESLHSSMSLPNEDALDIQSYTNNLSELEIPLDSFEPEFIVIPLGDFGGTKEKIKRTPAKLFLLSLIEKKN
jgi:hypothetical protein